MCRLQWLRGRATLGLTFGEPLPVLASGCSSSGCAIAPFARSAAWRSAVVHRLRQDGVAANASQFGDRAFWESRYTAGRAPREWFLSAGAAADSAAAALLSHRRSGLSAADSPLRCLHLGCGTSNLGGAICDALESEHRLAATVTNVDYSPAAIDVAARRADPRQSYHVWDVTDGSQPPAPPHGSGAILTACGPSTTRP